MTSCRLFRRFLSVLLALCCGALAPALPLAAVEASPAVHAVPNDGSLYEDPERDTYRTWTEWFDRDMQSLKESADDDGQPMSLFTFQTGLQVMLNNRGRAVRLTVHEQPKLIPAEEQVHHQRMMPNVQWLTYPKATVALAADSVRHYAESVAPVLDLFFRRAAQETESYDVTCVMKKTQTGCMVLDYADAACLEQVKAHRGNRNMYHLLVPLHPEDFESLEENKKVSAKVMVYYLPSEFVRPEKTVNEHVTAYDVNIFFYDEQRQYCDSENCTYNWSSCYYHPVLGWSYSWMLGTVLSQPVFPEDGSFYVAGQADVSRCLVTLRSKKDCFPSSEPEHPGCAPDGPLGISSDWALFHLPAIPFLFTPYMLWVLWQEKQRLKSLLPFAAGENAVGEDSFDASQLGPQAAQLWQWYAVDGTCTDEEGQEAPCAADKRSLEEGFRLAAAVSAMAGQLNEHELYCYRMAVETLERSQKRSSSVATWGRYVLIALSVLLFLLSGDSRLMLIWALVPLHLLLCTYAPTYKLMAEPPLYLVRFSLSWVLMRFSVLFRIMTEEKVITVYRDKNGKYWRDADEVDYQNIRVLIASILLIIMMVLFFPLGVMLYTTTHFWRNYVAQR